MIGRSVRSLAWRLRNIGKSGFSRDTILRPKTALAYRLSAAASDHVFHHPSPADRKVAEKKERERGNTKLAAALVMEMLLAQGVYKEWRGKIAL